MTVLKRWRMLFNGSTQPTRERTAVSTTDAPLTMADLERLSTFNRCEAYFASLIAAAKETPIHRQMTPWQRLQGFVDNSRYLRPLLCFLAAACIVIGLLAMRLLVTLGSPWLLP